MRNFRSGLAIAVAVAAALTITVRAHVDMRRTLGLVPTFMKAFPEVGIAAAWDEFKAVQLNPNTALNAKAKELIGLAVAAQIPCKYCVYFHTQSARLNGATDGEVKEAVAMAALTRHWSTVLNGMQIDEGTFKRDTTKVIAYLKKQSGTKPAEAAPSITDSASA